MNRACIPGGCFLQYGAVWGWELAFTLREKLWFSLFVIIIAIYFGLQTASWYTRHVNLFFQLIAIFVLQVGLCTLRCCCHLFGVVWGWRPAFTLREKLSLSSSVNIPFHSVSLLILFIFPAASSYTCLMLYFLGFYNICWFFCL